MYAFHFIEVESWAFGGFSFYSGSLEVEEKAQFIDRILRSGTRQTTGRHVGWVHQHAYAKRREKGGEGGGVKIRHPRFDVGSAKFMSTATSS